MDHHKGTESIEDQHGDPEKAYQQGLDYVRASEGEHSENLRHAIACFELAMQSYTVEAFPEKWQRIQYAMADAYSGLVSERLAQKQEPVPPLRQRNRLRFTWAQFLVLALIAIVALAIPTTVIARVYLMSGVPECVGGTLNMDGSTVLQPMLEATAEAYMQHCAGALITVGGGASKTGLADVEQGRGTMTDASPQDDPEHTNGRVVPIQIGDSDIFASPVQGDLVDHQIAIGVFAMIVNSDVTGLHNLTTAQIQGIYTGQYQNWSAIQDNGQRGPDLPIVPISRTVNSGTRFTFESYILQGVATVPGIGLDRASSSGNAVQEVEDVPGSIGYAPLYLTSQTPAVTTLSIDGNGPYKTSLVQQDVYRFWNIEHMYTRGPGSALAQSFISYVSSDAASSLLTRFYLLPLNDISQSIRSKHILEGR